MNVLPIHVFSYSASMSSQATGRKPVAVFRRDARTRQDAWVPSIGRPNAALSVRFAGNWRQSTRQGWQTFRNGTRTLWLTMARGVEVAHAQIKMGIIISLGLLSFLPMPKKPRAYLESKFLFGPIKASDVSLLQDVALRKQVNTSFLTLSRYAAELKQAGLSMNEGKDKTRISVWHIPAKGHLPTVVFSHGRITNNSRQEHVLKAFSDRGYGILVYDYPGFGESTGSPSEEGLKKSGLAVSLYAQKELGIPVSSQILMGTSLGSMVSSDTARRLCDHPELCENKKLPAALVLTNTFPRLKEVFVHKRDAILPALRHVFHEDRVQLKLEVQDNLKNHSTKHRKENTSALPIPLLLLQGEKDKDTPPGMAYGMFKAVTGIPQNPYETGVALKTTQHGKAQFSVIPNAKHKLRAKDYQTIIAELDRFLGRHGLPIAPVS